MGVSTCRNSRNLSRPVQGLLSLHIFSTDILHMRSFLPVCTSKMAVSWENLLCASHCQERILFVIIFSNPYYVKTFCKTVSSYCFCFDFHRKYENFIIARISKKTMFLLRGNICDLCLVRIGMVTQIILIEVFRDFSRPSRRRLGLYLALDYDSSSHFLSNSFPLTQLFFLIVLNYSVVK